MSKEADRSDTLAMAREARRPMIDDDARPVKGLALGTPSAEQVAASRVAFVADAELAIKGPKLDPSIFATPETVAHERERAVLRAQVSFVDYLDKATRRESHWRTVQTVTNIAVTIAIAAATIAQAIVSCQNGK
jgi:hypothetical protein